MPRPENYQELLDKVPEQSRGVLARLIEIPTDGRRPIEIVADVKELYEEFKQVHGWRETDEISRELVSVFAQSRVDLGFGFKILLFRLNAHETIR